MTKYSKIKKSSFAVLALSLVLVALLAFGGTYAYFSDTVTAAGGKVTTATLTLTDNVAITASADDLVPNQILPIVIGDVELGGTTISAVRFSISNVALKKGESTFTPPEGQANYLTVAAADVTGGSFAGWEKDGNYYYYKAYVKTLAINDSMTLSVTLNADAGNEWQGVEATFSITFEAVQAEYNGDQDAAPAYSLNDAKVLFGETVSQ